ncbi:MAG TPA: histone deacetylase [Gemmatimonadaceae bacterium]|nr:histone deacetylase [Gemmatimonadaceae bacterium]
MLFAWSSASYVVPLPPGHRFPMAKYRLLKERVIGDGIIPASRVLEPDRAPVENVRLVHTERYVEDIDRGRLDAAAERRLGFPWSPALVERSYRSVGGTIAAAHAALENGIAINLSGGTHHAFADHGEGFCVFNDVAIAIRALQREQRLARAVVIDLDVHQGNGTNAIFAGDERVYTFSMHGAKNYPFHRVPGCVDIELPDGTDDGAYLDILAAALPNALRAAGAQLVIYLAGADVLAGDRLGRLGLTQAGMARRDALVLEACREIGLPVAIVLGGGYGARLEDTVDGHVQTVRLALAYA